MPWYLIDTVEGGLIWQHAETKDKAMALVGEWATGFAYVDVECSDAVEALPAHDPRTRAALAWTRTLGPWHTEDTGYTGKQWTRTTPLGEAAVWINPESSWGLVLDAAPNPEGALATEGECAEICRFYCIGIPTEALAAADAELIRVGFIVPDPIPQGVLPHGPVWPDYSDEEDE